MLSQSELELKIKRRDLKSFFNKMSNKYLPRGMGIWFVVTEHCMERLRSRSASISSQWLCEAVSELFQHRLCEFLYILEVAPDHGRINIRYQGRTLGLLKRIREDGKPQIRVTTCFTGVATDPTLNYYILSLDKETTEEQTK